MQLVLVVENETASADALCSVLLAAGYRIAIAADAAAALDLLKNERPQVIMAECAIPSAPGVRLERAIRSDPRLAGIPLVAMSDLGPSDVRAFFDDYDSILRKPIAPEVVLPLVHHLARYGRPARKSL
jgi:CheY-like chemotaxis protein